MHEYTLERKQMRIVRVTESMMANQFLNNLTNINNRMNTLQNQLSSGKSFTLPSQDPLAVSQDMSIRAILSQSSAYAQTASSGLSWMKTTAQATQNIIQELQSLQGVVSEGINATNQNSSTRQALADTATQLVQNIYDLTNTQQGSRYVFGGTQTDTAPSSYLQAPVPPASAPAVPSGATSSTSLSLSPTITMPMNITGTSLFLTSPSSGGTVPDLSATLASIATDLTPATYSSNNLSQDLGNLQANLTQVINTNAGYGAQIAQVQTIQTQTANYVQTVTNQKGTLENANMANVITQFNSAQAVYQSALKVGSNILLPSLISFLPNG